MAELTSCSEALATSALLLTELASCPGGIGDFGVVFGGIGLLPRRHWRKDEKVLHFLLFYAILLFTEVVFVTNIF